VIRPIVQPEDGWVKQSGAYWKLWSA